MFSAIRDWYRRAIRRVTSSRWWNASRLYFQQATYYTVRWFDSIFAGKSAIAIVIGSAMLGLAFGIIAGIATGSVIDGFAVMMLVFSYLWIAGTLGLLVGVVGYYYAARPVWEVCKHLYRRAVCAWNNRAAARKARASRGLGHDDAPGEDDVVLEGEWIAASVA